MISYKPLWKTLIDRDMTKEELREKIGVSRQLMTNMSKGKPVSLKYVDRICDTLNCSLSDVIEHQ